MKERKKKPAKKIKSQEAGSNRTLRRIILGFALLSIIAFITCVFLLIENGRKIGIAKDKFNEQIIYLSDLDSNYFSATLGNPQSISRLKENVNNFEKGLKVIRSGEEGMEEPSSAQLVLLNKIDTKWQKIKPYFSSSIRESDAAQQLIASAENIALNFRDIAINAEIVQNNLISTYSKKREVSGLSSQIIVTANDAANIVSTFAENKKADKARETSNNLETHIQTMSDLVRRINSIIQNAQDIAFELNTGRESIDKMQTRLNTLQQSLDTMFPSDDSEETKRSAEDLKTHETELMATLRELKDTYDTTNSNVHSLLPITMFKLTMIALGFAVVLTAAWAFMLLIDGVRLNREATKLRVAAEERTKRDQEAILRLINELADLSEGDLTIEAQVTEDFTGAIADSINFTIENMRDMVGTITHTSEEITRATEVSQNVSYLLTESSGEQSKQINASANTVRSMAKSLFSIAENTNASVEIARSSVDMAQEGRHRVRSTIKSMSDIRENIQETAKRIKRLGESSQEIGDIVEIIKGIADQTNVLALNAAIQATAAGEAGRGFAVVADEVQRLAERSANATKQIEVLVKTIQADANEAVSSMESSTKQVVTGTDVAEEAGQSLDQIEKVSKNLANLIVNVSKATRDAAGMAGNVSKSMARLAELNEKAVQDVATSVQSVSDLKDLSGSLKDSVAGFKL